MSHYFQSTALSGVNHCLDYIKNQMVTEGWTVFHLNNTTGYPAEDHIRYSYVFISNGKTGSVGDLPANHGIWMGWAQMGSDSHLIYGVFAGYKRVPTGSISKSSNVVTVNATNHGLRVGDVLLVGGTGNEDFHSGWTTDDGPLTVASVPNANTFTYSDTANTANISPTTFENIFAMYNCGGTFSAREASPVFTVGEFNGQSGNDDPELDIYGFADEYRVCGTIVTAGVHNPFYLGLTGRGHVPDSWQHVGRLVSNVTGTGSPQILQLDRNCPKMAVNQPIWLVPTNDSDGQKNDDLNSISRGGPSGAPTTASAKPTDSSVQVTLRSGDEYPPGTLVGFDPCPLYVSGFDGLSTVDLDDRNHMVRFQTNGTVIKTIGSTGSYEYTNADINIFGLGGIGTSHDGELNPQPGKLYHGFDIIVTHNTTTPSLRGIRYPLPGFVGWGKGNQADGDLMVVGRNIAANRWKVFTTQEVSDNNGSWILGIGPGAT